MQAIKNLKTSIIGVFFSFFTFQSQSHIGNCILNVPTERILLIFLLLICYFIVIYLIFVLQIKDNEGFNF